MKRTLSLVLAIALVFSMMATGLVSQAASFSDIATHWAKSEIEYMAGQGVLNGYTDGTFKPENYVKKSEFIKMMNYTFGLKDTTYRSFADVKTTDWFYNDIQKAAANGYLTTNGNYVSPETNLTRQEAAALLARYLGLETSSYSYTYSFTDSAQISATYRNYVMACVAAGIFQGDAAGTFRPNDPIKRGEAVTVLKRIIGTFVDNSTSTVTTSDAAIVKSGVSLYNAIISGDLLITEGAEGGTVTLYNTTVYGNIRLKGAVTLKLVNSTVSSLTTDTDGTTSYVDASGTSVIRNTILNTPAVVSNNTTSESYGFTTVNTANGTGTANTLTGTFKTVNVTTSGTTLNLSEGTVVETLNIASGATNTAVKGKGYAEQLNVNAAGATIETAPKAYKIASGLSAVIAGVTRTGTGTGMGEYPKMYVLSNNTVEIKNLTSGYYGTTYWMAVSRGATAPTAAQIKNGSYGYYGYSGYVDSGSFSHSAGVEASDYTKALAAGAYYDIYYFTEYYNNSTAATNVTYKTVYVTSAPTFTRTLGTKSYNSSYNSYTQTVTISAASATNAYVVAVPSGYYVSAPTASQVYEAATGIGTYKPTGMITATGTVGYYGSNTVTLTGMNSGNYDVYVVVANNTGYTPVLSAVNGTSNANVYVSGSITGVSGGYVNVAYTSTVSDYFYFQVLPKGTTTTAAQVRNAYTYYNNVNREYHTGSAYADSMSVYNTYSITSANLANYWVAVVVGNANNVNYLSVPATFTVDVKGHDSSSAGALTTSANIVLTFSDYIYDGTTRITSTTSAATLAKLFVLKDSTGAAVPATIQVDTTGKMVAIDPTNDLAAGATYTVTVDVNNSTGVQAPTTLTIKTKAAGTSTPSTPSTSDVTIKVEDAKGEVAMGANNTYDVYVGEVKVTLTEAPAEAPMVYLGATTAVEELTDTGNSTTGFASYSSVLSTTITPNGKLMLAVKYASGTTTDKDGKVETTYKTDVYYLNNNVGSAPIVKVTDSDGNALTAKTVEGETVYVASKAGVFDVYVNTDGAEIKNVSGTDDWDLTLDATVNNAIGTVENGTSNTATIKYTYAQTAGYPSAEQTIKIVVMPELKSGMNLMTNKAVNATSENTYSATVYGKYAIEDNVDYLYLTPEIAGADKYMYQIGSGEAKEATGRRIQLSEVLGDTELAVGESISNKKVTAWYIKEGIASEKITITVSMTCEALYGQVKGVDGDTATLTQGANSVVYYNSATTITNSNSATTNVPGYWLGFYVEAPEMTKVDLTSAKYETANARYYPNHDDLPWDHASVIKNNVPVASYGGLYSYLSLMGADYLNMYAGEVVDKVDYAKYAKDITCRTRLDWDGDGTWDQYVELKINPKVITLMDGTTQVYPTPAN